MNQLIPGGLLIAVEGIDGAGKTSVAALLAQGADPNAEGFAGETALSFAKQTGDAALVRMLIASGAKN